MLKYGFFNSINHDRVYDAEDMSAIFNNIITDGVFDNYGTFFATRASGNGMYIIVGSGRAWFNSTWTISDSDITLAVPAADVSLTRIDSVILEVDHSTGVRANSIKILKGTASSNPQAPALRNGPDVYQHALAYITIPANTSTITNSMINVLVGRSGCPYVTSVLESVSIDALFAKWENDFTTWFNDLQAYLNEDVVANLQNQINSLKNRMTNVENNKVDKTTYDNNILILKERINKDWVLYYSQSSVGSYNFTFPNILNGKPYIVGIWVVGGGGSGGANYWTKSSTEQFATSGGGSGYANFAILQVYPGQQSTLIVGAGGASVTATGTTTRVFQSGLTGGSSSFVTGSISIVANGGGGGSSASGKSSSATKIYAIGGKGAQSSLSIPTDYNGNTKLPNAFGGMIDNKYAPYGCPGQCVHPFENTLCLAGGGGAIGYLDYDSSAITKYYIIAPGLDPRTNIGGGVGAFQGGTVTVRAGNATKAGCGGGGAIVSQSGTARGGTAISGAGADGTVAIYIRGV